MRNESNAWILSRRSALTLAGACLLPLKELHATEFWNKKDPGDWTGEEIDQLTTKSPWAKSVSVTAPSQGGGNGQGYPRSGGGYPGGGYPGGGGMGYPGGGMGRRGGMGGPSRYPQGTTYKGTVRWESAQPILDALKTPLPDAFKDRYVIGVRDIPLITNQRQTSSQNPDDTDPDAPKLAKQDQDADSSNKRMIDDLKMATDLTVKGKSPAQPGVIQQMTPGGTYFLFGFSKDLFDIGKKDHEIAFSTILGRITVKTKFDPSEMMYRGKLAI